MQPMDGGSLGGGRRWLGCSDEELLRYGKRFLWLTLTLTLACGWIAFQLATAYHFVRKAEDWPTVQGELTSVDLGETRGVLPFAHPGHGLHHAWFRSLDVTYAYEVEGVRYTSNRIAFYSSKSALLRHGRTFREVGQSVPVRVDPANPSRSVLHNEPSGALTRDLLGSLVFLGLFASVAVWLFRSLRALAARVSAGEA